MENYRQLSKKILTGTIIVGLLGGFSTVSASYPSYFDYRREVYDDKTSSLVTTTVPEVRNQGLYGTCWSFAALASYETAWNLKLQANEISGTTPYFSERYLAWLAYHAPLDGTWSDPKYHMFLDESSASDKSTASLKAYTGAMWDTAFMEMLRWGNALSSQYPYDSSTGKNMAGVDSIVASSGAVHDYYSSGTALRTLAANSTDYLKQLLEDTSVVTIAVNSKYFVGSGSEKNIELYNTTGKIDRVTHSVSIVGWDDDYEFKYCKDSSGNPLVGAWIVRNSWGTGTGDDGYFYIPYADTTFRVDGSFNPELDTQRYTRLDTNNYVSRSTWSDKYTSADNQLAYANKLSAQAPQMLKAVNFYVSNDNTSYKIEVLLEGSSPTDGKVVYTQSGTFGSDGTLGYRGYRTVDLNKFVFLPQGETYVVKITLTAPNAAKQTVSFVGNRANTQFADVSSSQGLSYVYNYTTGSWEDTYNYTINNYTQLSVPVFGRSKDSALANGGDFTVVSLNDYGLGGSYVNLGSATELYGTDLLNPDRVTLSNMTVELTAGLTDSVYGGVIFGEGSVTKAGTGTLVLTGDNLYTGNTYVKDGTLALLRQSDGSGGSLNSDVHVANAGTLTGNGTIKGDVFNSGLVCPGDSIGTLTVNNYEQTAEGRIDLEGGVNVSDVLNILGTSHIDGEVHFIPLGYFANGENVLYIKDSDFTPSNNMTITAENALRPTVSVIAASASVADKSCTFVATRAANAYSSQATTEDGAALGRVLDKVAGYQTGDGQNLVAGIDFYDLSIDDLGTQMQPRSYDSLMNANMKAQQFVGRSLTRELLNDDHTEWLDTDQSGTDQSAAASATAERSDSVKSGTDKSDVIGSNAANSGAGKLTAQKPVGARDSRIFAKALRYSDHQNSWGRYDGYDSMVSGVLVGYEREAHGWRYGVHGAYLSGNTDLDDAATPLHNDYYSGTIGVHGIKNMDRDFLYGYVEGIWEHNEATRSASNSLYNRTNEAEWNGSGFNVSLGGGHRFKSEKYRQSLIPYAGLSYSQLHWGEISESCDDGDSMSIDRGSSDYKSLIGTLGLRAQLGPHFVTGTKKTKVSYDATVAYEHEFMKDMPSYGYSVLGTDLYQNGSRKPARDVVSAIVGANIAADKKFTLRGEVGKAWGSQGFHELQVGIKGEWKF